jgi:hypothetical protein
MGIHFKGEVRGPYPCGAIATLKFKSGGITLNNARDVTFSDLLLVGPGKGNGIDIDSVEGTGGSMMVTIERCGFTGWNVAIMHNASKTVAQGNSVLVDDCYIEDCDYGFASGQSQARATKLRDVKMGRVGTCVDNVTFGQQRGTPPVIDGGEWNGCGQLFNVGTFMGPFSVRDLYAEDIESLGTISEYSNCNNQPAKLDGCHFAMRAEKSKPIPDLLFGTDVRFSGSIQGYGQTLTFTLAANTPEDADAPQLVFDGAGLRTENPDALAGIVCDRKRVLFRQTTVFDPRIASRNSAAMQRLDAGYDQDGRPESVATRCAATPGDLSTSRDQPPATAQQACGTRLPSSRKRALGR